MAMQTRRATIRDILSVAACETQAFAPFAPVIDSRDARSNRALTAQIEDGLIHVMCEGMSVAGYISIWPAGDHLFVDTLAVLPKRHGQGIGSSLLAFADREAMRIGLSSVRLFTKEKMAGNLGFYRRRGYRETGRCDDDGFARVFYVKDVPLRAAGTGKARAV